VDTDTEEHLACWLVLLFQFPKGSDSRRVKVWRRLQDIGAVAIKNSVYVLPLNDQSREDFEWLLAELKSSGADGAILESRVVGGITDQTIRDIFNASRTKDYEQLMEDIGAIENTMSFDAEPAGEDHLEDKRRALRRGYKRMTEIEGTDFFGAEGHDAVETALRRLADHLTTMSGEEKVAEGKMQTVLHDLSGRVWVTRQNIRVDRIASAWLIRRWIDPTALFKFVSHSSYQPKAGEIRFDMYEGEFGHQDDKCTFEVLAYLARPNDGALRRISEIVHDIDLKDSKFARPETQGVAAQITGIVADTDDDLSRIEQGSAMFENLYSYFSSAQA
jgi:hypothetical protein